MAEDIVRQGAQTLIDGWLKAEQEGEAFPVDFDLAWTIAGYSTKGNAKKKLLSASSKLTKGKDFAFIQSDKWSQGGRSSDLIEMSCDGFKQFCLMANTDEGTAIRLYFIDAEKKWKLVQQHAPQVASEIEMMQYRIELAKIEAQKEQAISAAKEADERLLMFRHVIATTMPEPVQQKILGYSEVKTVEYRDRVIHDDDIIRDGSTINKTEMCRRLNFLTKGGSPDYKRLNRFLLTAKIPVSAWKLVASIRENEEMDLAHWQEVESKWMGSDRNLFVGE